MLVREPLSVSELMNILKPLTVALILIVPSTIMAEIKMPEFNAATECSDSSGTWAGCERAAQEIIDLNYQSWDKLSEKAKTFCAEHSHTAITLNSCIMSQLLTEETLCQKE
jgi:hypothetical protein